MRRTFATADIGSNTVHLLVAVSDGTSVSRGVNQSEWLSLGETVARHGLITEDKAALLLEVLRNCQTETRNAGASSLYVFATEAIRVATNSEAVLAKIRNELGISVDVISPAKEAEYSLRGVGLDCTIPPKALLFEVGGGSAQIALCEHGAIIDEVSLPLGTGKLTASANLEQPAHDASLSKANQIIHEQVDSIPFHVKGIPAIASGGVIRGIWRALHPDLDQELAREELEYLEWSTSRLSVNRIIQRYGVKAKRAAALLPGTLVYRALLDHFELNSIRVSQYGVREGAVMMLAEGKVPAWVG